MNIRELINRGAELLNNNSDTPRLDANILLAFTLDMSRASLMAHYPDPVDSSKQEIYLQYITKRAEGYPISYIVGEKEFFGLIYHVEDGVLTPRPDSEVLIEQALRRIEENNFNSVLDMCTGTGCLAISIQHSNLELNVTATDISPIAERVFHINNKKLVENRVNFIHSDLFNSIKEKKFDIIVTNPPYLTAKETTDRVDEGWKEPVLALDGGDDGLDLIRIIIKEAPQHINSGGYLMIEADPAQMDTMGLLMKAHGFTDIETYEDLAGFTRIIVGKI